MEQKKDGLTTTKTSKTQSDANTKKGAKGGKGAKGKVDEGKVSTGKKKQKSMFLKPMKIAKGVRTKVLSMLKKLLWLVQRWK